MTTPLTAEELRVFLNIESDEYFVAESLDEARRMFVYGDEERIEDESENWQEMPGNRVMRVDVSDEGDGSDVRSMTCAEWAQYNGKGYLCCRGN